MKILQIVQRNYAVLGIEPNKKYPFNKRLHFGFLLFGFTLISQFAYIFHVETGFMDYMNSICATSSTILMFVNFSTIVFKRALAFECIDFIEKRIDISESLFIFLFEYNFFEFPSAQSSG